MPIINVVVVLIVVGVLLWLVNQFVPMEPRIKSIMNAVVIISIVLWILSLFFTGIWNIGNIRVPTIR
jgi:hypothetical protein